MLPLTKAVYKEMIPVLNKPLIHLLVEEAIYSGIEEIILVLSPRKLQILDYFNADDSLNKILKEKGKIEILKKIEKNDKIAKFTVVIQNEQLGLANAIFMAADVIDDEPFGIILGDDLIESEVPALKQLIDIYNQTNSSVIGVKTVSDDELSKHGIIEPKTSDYKDRNYFEIKRAIEKPSIDNAPSNEAIIGRYIFTPELMPLLRNLKAGKNNETNLVDAFELLGNLGQKIYAKEIKGTRYDLGSIEGFIKANIDYALKDKNISSKIKEHIRKIDK